MKIRLSRTFAVCAAMLAVAVLLPLLSAGFPVYSRLLRAAGLYVSAGLSWLLSVIPLPLSEWILLLLLPAVAALFIFKIRRHGAAKGARQAAVRVLCVACAAALLFSLTLGVQYSAPPLASRLGLYVGRYSAQQLAELTRELLERANYYAERVPRNSAGECVFGAFSGQAAAVMDAYRALSGETALDFSVFSTPRTAPPKQALIFSVPMSYLGIAGYFFPWTTEAVVSRDSVDVQFPFTIAHEAAHGFGIAAEDEANFAAFLACRSSPDVRLAYSAYFSAYLYASNALYAADYEIWSEVTAARGDKLSADLMELNAHLAKYETPIKNVGEAVNNAYIKATGQPDGVRTYGMVVDLLLALHFIDNPMAE